MFWGGLTDSKANLPTIKNVLGGLRDSKAKVLGRSHQDVLHSLRVFVSAIFGNTLCLRDPILDLFRNLCCREGVLIRHHLGFCFCFVMDRICRLDLVLAFRC